MRVFKVNDKKWKKYVSTRGQQRLKIQMQFGDPLELLLLRVYVIVLGSLKFVIFSFFATCSC